MDRLVKVTSKKEARDFVNFPLELYKDCPYFVPPLYGDEMALFKKNHYRHEDSPSAFYLVYRDGKVVGRIQAILSKPSNERRNQKRIRFSRFDCIDDQNVAHMLFEAAEGYARENGMDTVCGPLGYSDMEREGLLIEGFEELSTFEEQYNYPYYQKLIENEGYVKEVEWVEHKLYAPKVLDERIGKIATKMMERNKLRFVTGSTRQLVKRYGQAFFDIIDENYRDLYMTVPFSKGEMAEMIKSFKLIINSKYLRIIVDENDKVVAVGLCFPSIGKALQKSGGRLTLPCLLRLYKSLKKPKILDLGLIALDPKYRGAGVAWAIFYEIMKMLYEGGVAYCETNLNLEDNANIQNNWDRFENVLHKRRRSFVKVLS